MTMRINTVDEAYKELEPLIGAEITKHENYPDIKRISRGFLSMGYALGAATVLLGQYPKSLEELLEDPWIKSNLTTED